MDRPRLPSPRLHSHSESAVPQVSDPPVSPPGTVNPADTLLRRPHSATISPVSTSHPPPFATEDESSSETWLDFVRNTNGGSGIGPPGRDDMNVLFPGRTPPSRIREAGLRPPGHTIGTLAEARNALLADQRKRRLTAPDTPVRASRYAPAGFGAGSSSSAGDNLGGLRRGSAGGVRGDNFMDLTDDDGRATGRSGDELSQNRRPSGGRKPSDIVLPRWQPDAEVQDCPVCGNTFSFWYRKHHCRKCGRVVCANCSPHRITIPRQFIVSPPQPTSRPSSTFIDLTSEEDGSTSPIEGRFSSALGGGETVRVCNPCVPDPNFSPPPQHFLDQTSPALGRFPPLDFPNDHVPARGSSLQQPRPRGTTYDSPQNRPPVPPHHRPPHRLSSSEVSGMRPELSRPRHPDVFHGRRTSFTSRSSTSDLWPPPPPPPHDYTGRSSAHPAFRQMPSMLNNAPSSPFPVPAPNSRYRSLVDTSPAPAPAPPRRQVAEEDECPVCGDELPPKGPDGSETAREAHVENCIKTHFTTANAPSPPPPPVAAVSPAVAATASSPRDAGAMSSSAPSGSRSRSSTGLDASPSTPGSATASMSRPRRHTGNRMLVYKATEKDCMGEDGGEQECVICFEEFEPGCEMGRLECLCKFHRVCIRQWWGTKGVGSCPTHQLHE